MSFFDDAIGSIGQGLAQTAIQAASNETGVNVGGLIGVLYGGNQTAGGQNLAQVVNEITKFLPHGPGQTAVLTVLEQQNQTLASMGQQLAAVSQSLNVITADLSAIQAQLSKIAQQQAYQAWETVDTQLTLCLNAISTAYGEYGSYMADYKKTPPSDIDELVNDILSLDPDAPAAGLSLINDYIVGEGQRQGVLQLWTAMVVPIVQAGQLDYRDAVRQYESYYQTLVYAQLCATNLIMEGQNFRGAPDQVVDAWNTYKKFLLMQEDAFIESLIPLIPASQNGLPASFTAVHGAMQLNPGLQQLSGTAAPFYEPSAVFQRAEELLASLSVTDPGARRIVVHMLYITEWGLDGMLAGVNLTLQGAGGGTPISAASDTKLGPPFVFPGSYPADVNFVNAGGFFVKRFVYSGAGLSDGAYRITDMNGQGGLIPVETYASRSGAPFLSDDVTAYTLSVNASQPFDFMNFMAYSAPSAGPLS